MKKFKAIIVGAVIVAAMFSLTSTPKDVSAQMVGCNGQDGYLCLDDDYLGLSLCFRASLECW